jgi:Zn-dependent peptidase ImmA (M78 family)/transcriptional regulator with XRE-family HTH domain
MTLSPFDLLFGPESTGITAEQRAISSKKLFVRSQDHLALNSIGAKGHVLTAWEVYQNYGIETINEVFEEGSAILADSIDEPSASFKKRREQLGLSVTDIASYAHVKASDVADIENPKSRKPIRLLEKVAAVLGLDERLISYSPGAGGDAQLSVRLRELGAQTERFSAKTVLAFHEAAWVILTEDRLKRWVKSSMSKPVWQQFSPSGIYGDSRYPAWRHGYHLAHETRKILGFEDEAPIKSFRNLFMSLDLPLVQVAITKSIAGATLANGDSRGVVVNTVGANDNVWVRRVTMAHELGHLLWDPEINLNKVRVDKYVDIEKDTTIITDFVEQRANAFAVEFLAPQDVVKGIYHDHSDKAEAVKEIMNHFGISYTSVCHHIRNAFGLRTANFEKPVIGDFHPTDEWNGTESFTNDYFPIPTTNQIRRGDFASIVIEAEGKGLISKNTAAEYLNCTEEAYESAKPALIDIYPTL